MSVAVVACVLDDSFLESSLRRALRYTAPLGRAVLLQAPPPTSRRWLHYQILNSDTCVSPTVTKRNGELVTGKVVNRFGFGLIG